MLRTAGRLRRSLTVAIGGWAEAQADGTDAVALAEETARSIAALAQGYIANTAVFGPRSVDEYLTTAAAVLES
jgi:hypothetical protein